MTEKQENIILVALHLFAENGYAATPTSKIAKKAGVSEGLIFRHFGNKKGLLKVIMENTQKEINDMFRGIFNEENPKMVLKKVIQMPLTIKPEQYDYWKFQYKLRWETDYTGSEKLLSPILSKFEEAFKQLGYKDPKQEAILFNHIMNSMAIDILLNRFDNSYINFLINKYNL